MTGWTLRSCNVGLPLGVSQSEVICIAALGNCLPVLHRMLLLSVRHELSEITDTNADSKQSYGLLMNRTNTDRHSCDIFHAFCAKGQV